jgi:hypothetical protein
MSPRAKVLDKKGSAGCNMEKYAVFSAKFGRIEFLLSFNNQNFAV